jgi:hypothetical protein
MLQDFVKNFLFQADTQQLVVVEKGSFNASTNLQHVNLHF